MSETFLNYRHSRWLWINLGFLVLLSVVYCVDTPLGGKSGSTWIGYIYGFIAAAGIVYLMWYGMRKRAYASSSTTLKGCLSAHVWLGVSLAFIVPLHSGFQFGLNIHTLAYVLMLVVILSGIYGAVNYTRLAPLIAAHRGGGHAPLLLEHIQRLSTEISSVSSLKSDTFQKLVRAADFELTPGVWRCMRRLLVPELKKSAVSELLAQLSGEEHEAALKALSLITRKRELAEKLQDDIRTLAKLKLWLWIHLPVSLAMFVCVLAHVLIIFMYR